MVENKHCLRSSGCSWDSCKNCDEFVLNITEDLASYAHEVWIRWMKYLFSKSVENEDGSVTIPAWAVERWKRQMSTSYDDLPEGEKESDRKEARTIMDVAGYWYFEIGDRYEYDERSCD